MKSNLNLANAIKVLEKWQLQEDTDKLIYVSSFNLFPQEEKGKFALSIDMYIEGLSESYWDTKTKYFYGSIVNCINQAVDHIDKIKEETRSRL